MIKIILARNQINKRKHKTKLILKILMKKVKKITITNYIMKARTILSMMKTNTMMKTMTTTMMIMMMMMTMMMTMTMTMII